MTDQIPSASGVQGKQRKSRTTSQLQRLSLTTDAYGRKLKKVQYENTYRMEPKVLFPAEKATPIIQEILERRLEGMEYEAESCMETCKELAVEIKDRMKDFKVERYKLVAVVTIGPTANNEVLIASQCLFNPDFDTWASYSYKNNQLYAVGTIYALYRE